MRNSPSILQIICNDYIAALSLICPLIFWAFCLLFIVTQPGQVPPFLYIDLAITVLGLAVLLWRAYSIHTLFTGGDEVAGVISMVNFFRDRGRIEYQYTCHGVLYTAGNAVMKNARTRVLKEGMEVTLMVDPLNPKRAMLRDLYL